MEKDFRLTSSEYAKILDISVEALRSRRRRELENGNFILENGKYLWKRDRPIAVNKSVNDRLIRDPRSSSHAPRKRNRGALARGEKPDYPNWKMEDRNRVLALAKIRDGLGDEVVDEITPELFDMAKKKVAERKLKEVEKTLNKNKGLAPTPHGVNVTKYGTMLNARGLKSIDDREHQRLARKWYFNANDYGSGGSIFFGNFGQQEKEDRESVEIDPRDFTPDDREPEFRNKIEESIYRLKKNK